MELYSEDNTILSINYKAITTGLRFSNINPDYFDGFLDHSGQYWYPIWNNLLLLTIVELK